MSTWSRVRGAPYPMYAYCTILQITVNCFDLFLDFLTKHKLDFLA